MKLFVKILLYFLSIYTIYITFREILAAEYKLRFIRFNFLASFDKVLLVSGGIVLGIVLFFLKGRANRILSFILIAGNLIVFYLFIKYFN